MMNDIWTICIDNNSLSFFFFFNDTATTEIYTLSLHDALPISRAHRLPHERGPLGVPRPGTDPHLHAGRQARSEEHTSELQSHVNLVCRLLLEKKKIIKTLLNDDKCRNSRSDL